MIKEFDYSIELNFKNNVNVDYKVTYAYHKGTNPADHSVNPIGFVPAAPWATVHNELPLRFVGGTIKIDVGALPFESLPTVSDFKFTFYYANSNDFIVPTDQNVESFVLHFTEILKRQGDAGRFGQRRVTGNQHIGTFVVE